MRIKQYVCTIHAPYEAPQALSVYRGSFLRDVHLCENLRRAERQQDGYA